MGKRILVSLSALFLAFVILTISILRSASVKYHFNALAASTDINIKSGDFVVKYDLPPVSGVTPDNPFWVIKALKDKSFILVTTNSLKKAELMLSLADERLVYSKDLFDSGNFDAGLTVLTKAEKYLESSSHMATIARAQGIKTDDFLERLAIASLKHRQISESFLISSPEGARAVIVQTVDYPKNVFRDAKIVLSELGCKIPRSPFPEDR